MHLKRITVFCGSSPGVESIYASEAFHLGEKLAERGIELVYGGANVGLMGAVANGVLSKGGEVIGVLPHHLKEKEIAHDRLTQLILVETMHERKKRMDELSDAVIALPGGYGTLEELFEMLTWAQLGLHKKPIGLLNINGFYNSLIELLSKMVGEGFLKSANVDMLLVSEDINELLEKIINYNPADKAVEKWIGK